MLPITPLPITTGNLGYLGMLVTQVFIPWILYQGVCFPVGEAARYVTDMMEVAQEL